MKIIAKINLYLMLYPLLQLVTSILIVILLRSIFLYDTVHADSLEPASNKINDHNFLDRHLYKIVLGAVLITCAIMWYRYDMAHPADDSYDLLDISPLIEGYSMSLFEHLAKCVPDLLTRLPAGLTDAVVLKFSFMVMEGCKDTVNFRDIYLTVQELIFDLGRHAGTDDTYLGEIIRCYAQIYDQSSGYEKTIAKNLGIAHMALPYVIEFGLPLDDYIKMMFDTGLNHELASQFHEIAIQQSQLLKLVGAAEAAEAAADAAAFAADDAAYAAEAAAYAASEQPTT